MTLTKRKKRVREERKKINPKQICLNCGIKITKGQHHFYCNECWTPFRGIKEGKIIKKKLKRLNNDDI